MDRDRIWLGTRVPGVELAELADDQVVAVPTGPLFARHCSVVIGVPGAFTPVCARQHVPDFVRSATRLKAAGYDQLICVAPNDPFVLHAWSTQVDPDRRIRFLSDGNLDFCTGLGLQATERDFHLGTRSERYMLIVVDGVIRRLRVEASITAYLCTRAADALAP